MKTACSDPTVPVENDVCIGFSGLTLRFRFPTAITLPKYFEALQIPDPGAVDEEYELCLLTSPLELPDAPTHDEAGIFIYAWRDGLLRVHRPLTAADGCQVACFLSPSGKNKLYYPASRWAFYANGLHCQHLLGAEAMLLRHNAFLLHSSVVSLNGRAVLFSGPSGAGKSTMASLWAEYLGAQILNGDRCLVMERPDGFYGGGSLWCGTSGILRPEQAPIAGIILLNKAPENRLERLGIQGFAPLFSQTTVNSWDSGFMSKIMDLYTRLLDQAPVYRLHCRPDEAAVLLVYNELGFNG